MTDINWRKLMGEYLDIVVDHERVFFIGRHNEETNQLEISEFSTLEENQAVADLVNEVGCIFKVVGKEPY